MFRNNDFKKINFHINDIKHNALEEYKNKYEPTFKESYNICNYIINFIKKNKKIIYGGYAQNLLINNKNPKDTFYKELYGIYYNWPDIADIEFYSPDPILDIYNLTNELHKLNYKYIECKEGIHKGTFKIFVNFINYCDITYMPTFIYNKLPFINVKDIKCVHPHYMLIDTYRVIVDPLTSYFRLDKSINRFQILIKYYPINNTYNKIISNNNIDNNNIIKYIIKKIIYKSKLIVIGLYGYNYYIKKILKKNIIDVSYLELISNNINNDAKYIYKKLVNKYKNIKIKEYFPFFEYMDRRIEYYYNDNLILKLYSNNYRCIIYNYSLKKYTYFGTFSLIYLYFLINYYYYLINNKNNIAKFIYKLLGNMIFARDKYLNKKNITIIDKSPFQYFTVKCFGLAIDIQREYRLSIVTKGNKPKFKYVPQKKIPEYNFNNISGNQILNKKYLIL